VVYFTFAKETAAAARKERVRVTPSTISLICSSASTSCSVAVRQPLLSRKRCGLMPPLGLGRPSMIVKRKRAVGRHARNSGANKHLLLIERYRELALELPLAPVAAGLLEKTVQTVHKTPEKDRRTPG
jgi:hypothetical protein